MQKIENEKQINGSNGAMKSMPINEPTTQETEEKTLSNKTSVVERDFPISVLERQFETVREEFSESMNLLNSSGKVLLGALKQTLPPEESGRVVGDYTGQNIRKISKSLCQLVQTKTDLIKVMFHIARDGR